MTTQNVPSAYPAPVADLLPRARSLAAELDQVPSRNRLMSELRIGAPKARAVRAALQDGTDPSNGVKATTSARLQAVPDPAEPTEPETATGTGFGTESGEPATGSGSESGDKSGSDPSSDPSRESGSEAAPAPLSTPGTKPDTTPGPDPRHEPVSAETARIVDGPVTWHADPDPTPVARSRSRVRSWPVLLLAAPAFVAIWSGWVGLGSLTGFGTVHPLPGIWDSLRLNTAITLPIGMETYAAYALRVWVAGRVPARARRFAKYSAIGALALGALGQVAYHLMAAAGVDQAPWPITTAVSCLPVVVLGMGAALAHLLHTDTDDDTEHADRPHEGEEAAR